MRKHNRIRKNKTMYYRPKIQQNFDTWYFPLKQTPAWFSYKTKKWQYPPIIKTNPFLEKSQRKLINKTATLIHVHFKVNKMLQLDSCNYNFSILKSDHIGKSECRNNGVLY